MKVFESRESGDLYLVIDTITPWEDEDALNDSEAVCWFPVHSVDEQGGSIQIQVRKGGDGFFLSHNYLDTYVVYSSIVDGCYYADTKESFEVKFASR